MRKWSWVLLLGMILSLGLMAGCSDDDDPVDPPEEDVLPGDPGQLMVEFVQVYELMDGDRLAELVHPEAKVFLLPSTVAEWAGGDNPLTFTYFERDSLLAAHQNIFTGEMGRDAGGIPIPPVASISVELFVQNGAWDEYPDPEEEFGGLDVYSVLFNVEIYFNNPDQHRFQVSQMVEFFVTEVGPTEQLPQWQLLGWRGLESWVSKSTESTYWDEILCLYR